NARPGGAAALGVIDGAADTAPGFKNWKHSHARITALESQLAKFPEKSQQEIADHVGCSQQYIAKLKADITTSCNIPATRKDSTGKNRPTAYKPTPPAPPAASQKPAVAAHTVTTAKLEELAAQVFGEGALPPLAGLSDAEKRTALAREFWQAHLDVPGAEVSAADAHAKHWRRADKLTGVFATIAAYRQQRADAFLGRPPTDTTDRMPRAAFNELHPRQQLEFCRNGGQVTD
ncbi:MAG: hypothetical protein EBS05_27765, partial [Proteobacteria bacterium]|nr:hypothetical protein [Pseudomonadota bacterium]